MVGLLNELNSYVLLKVGDKVMIVLNLIIVLYYFVMVEKVLIKFGCSVDFVLIFDGEKYKNLELFNLIFIVLFEKNYNCDIIFIVLGGGVIGDIVGYVVVFY